MVVGVGIFSMNGVDFRYLLGLVQRGPTILMNAWNTGLNVTVNILQLAYLSRRIMSRVYSKVYIHIVFGTKNRIPYIDPRFEMSLFNELKVICEDRGALPLAIGGYRDHVHVLCRLPTTISISILVRDIKRLSSRFMKDHHPDLACFTWQRGYGVFTAEESSLTRLKDYIKNQKAHHGNGDSVADLD